jgi:hypothetical protein
MSQERSDGQGTTFEAWPPLPLEEWKDTYYTLHMWTQIVGKIALAQAPMINHWWQAMLRVTSRGLTTLPLPHGERTFQIAFDFVHHRLRIESSDGGERSFALASLSVANFYREAMDSLAALGLEVHIWTTPVEVESRTPFEQDRQHASYDPEYARRFWQILVETDRVFREFRSRFVGKVSPVQFFWGSFDLAVTRFSGRRAPAYSGGAFSVGRWVMEEYYSHEQSSLGFWPGGGAVPYPAYYSYVVPQPAGFAEAGVRPAHAFHSKDLGEFILPYDDVRKAANPDDVLLEFAQSTYEAAADLGNWDREGLERGDARAIT